MWHKRFAHIGPSKLVERIPMALLIISIVVVGVYPSLLTDVFDVGLDLTVVRIVEAALSG